ncbi:uncharacterized protein LOC116345814 isoform X2 [Contarinia nasturtii]|uniref:uncharacterized protein LOC116345814 isoform X2 n=1 Tax=Contarinia nasturtii TaxID=265458 RepID=UPI0012D49B87|nr:uncharacterized protein LOC116345814 isoform X2 [Contarinia nasturtii]
MKNFLLISILAMTVVSFLPRTTYGSTTTEVEEQPQALPLTADKKPVGEFWQEDEREVLVRLVRGAKNNNGANNGSGSASCRYEKSQWTECNPETNVRTRTLSLKKGDEGCIPTRTIQKKCKKACRYDKGEWSKCVNGSMSRKDNVRSGSDASCKPTREITKNCNKDKKQKKQDKNGRKGHA